VNFTSLLGFRRTILDVDFSNYLVTKIAAIINTMAGKAAAHTAHTIDGGTLLGDHQGRPPAPLCR